MSLRESPACAGAGWQNGLRDDVFVAIDDHDVCGCGAAVDAGVESFSVHVCVGLLSQGALRRNAFGEGFETREQLAGGLDGVVAFKFQERHVEAAFQL